MALAITIKPQHLVNILNGKKLGEVRKNKSLINAIKKEIAEKGKATIYCICSKGGKGLTMSINGYRLAYNNKLGRVFNGKVVCKFECKKIEELYTGEDGGYYTDSIQEDDKVEKLSCLDTGDIEEYLNGSIGYFIHISNLTIFDKPKELKELKHLIGYWDLGCLERPIYAGLERAPQNFCYIEDTL